MNLYWYITSLLCATLIFYCLGYIINYLCGSYNTEICRFPYITLIYLNDHWTCHNQVNILELFITSAVVFKCLAYFYCPIHMSRPIFTAVPWSLTKRTGPTIFQSFIYAHTHMSIVAYSNPMDSYINDPGLSLTDICLHICYWRWLPQ